MSTLVRIEDVEEFRPAGGIPRHAVSEQILSGVRALNEASELEPSLRAILPDRTETAHTSTEIADILTTHVTVRGRAQLAAFVNKGRATRKVTSKGVAHQLIRLESVPGVTLVVLLAVGDIQDDAKRDLLRVAQNMGADCLIVDAVDVARILIAHHKICPRDGSPYRNGQCSACGDPVSQPIPLTLPAYERPFYEVLEDRDISAGPLKRYRRKIRTDPHYQRSILREVIKEALYEARTLGLHHSDQAERYFGDREADYVKLFVYLTGSDVQNENPYCTSCWLRPEYHESHASLREKRAEPFGDIDIGWSTVYDDIKDAVGERVLSKADWLKNISVTVPKMDELIDSANVRRDAYKQGRMEQAGFEKTFGESAALADDIDAEVSEWGAAPLECRDCNTPFQGMLGAFHNTFLAFSDRVRRDNDLSRKLALVDYSRELYAVDRERFLYELEKIDARTHRRLTAG